MDSLGKEVLGGQGVATGEVEVLLMVIGFDMD